ncbi:MAG TPA: hypothetical protein VFI47_23625 [Acidimicrobiales bacterium]|nr:hypothetical protein [Acidimicrobiales bacterium]
MPPESPAADADAAAPETAARLRELTASARRAGRRAVISGRWLADTVVDVAPRLPVRSAAALSAHHGGLTGDELARSVVRAAGRVSGGLAATAGGVIAAQELSIAGLVLVPFELAAVTTLVVVTEVKLVTELHHVAGRPLPGGPRRRAEAAVVSWMSGRAGPPDPVVATVRGDVLGRAGRAQLRTALRARFTRNLSALAPLLTGAVAAGVINRRATLDIGGRVARDLGLHP